MNPTIPLTSRAQPNSLQTLLELGEPQNASPEIQQQIRDAAAIVAEECGSVSPQNEIITVNMTENAVVLLELHPGMKP